MQGSLVWLGCYFLQCVINNTLKNSGLTMQDYLEECSPRKILNFSSFQVVRILGQFGVIFNLRIAKLLNKANNLQQLELVIFTYLVPSTTDMC